jgi:hypothetical protein
VSGRGRRWRSAEGEEGAAGRGGWRRSRQKLRRVLNQFRELFRGKREREEALMSCA